MKGVKGGARTSRGTGCGRERPKLGDSSTYVRETRRCVGVRKASREMLEIKMLCFVRERRCCVE